MSWPFLKEEKIGLRTQQTFIGNKCEMFIPEYYFNKNDKNAIAKDFGDRIETIGLFWFRVNDRDWYELTMPMKFQFQFTSVEKRTFKLKPEIPEMTFMVYILNNGDAFLYDRLMKKDVDRLKDDFIDKLIEKGKLPAFVSYDDVLQIFLNAMEGTGYTSLAVNSISIEFMLSELFRNKRMMSEPFRMIYNGKNEYGYKMIRITKVPELNSTFTGLIGEDISGQLISAVVKNRSGVEEVESPIEKMIKY